MTGGRTLRQLVTFYGVATVNTAFGYCLYAALVAAGLDLFVAQVVSHFCGMAFNYFTYRRHVFRGSRAAIARYLGAYLLHYGLGLGLLATFHSLIASAYVSGLLAMLVASAINFLVLKFVVFRPRAPEPAPCPVVRR